MNQNKVETGMDYNQGRTYTNKHKPVSFVSTGLQSSAAATVTVKPGLDCHGVYFFREDVETNEQIIDMSRFPLPRFTLSFDIANHYGLSAKTIENVRSALSASHPHNVKIETKLSKVSVENSRNGIFATTIRSAIDKYFETSQRSGWMKQPLAVTYGEEYSLLLPHPVPKITINIEKLGKVVFLQCYSSELTTDSYFSIDTDISWANVCH